MDGYERNAAEIVDGEVIRHLLEESWDDRDSDASVRAALDHPQQNLVRGSREAQHEVLDLVTLDDPVEVPARSEHRKPNLLGRRVQGLLVQKTNRAQADLGVSKEAIGQHATDRTRSDNQRRRSAAVPA